MFTWIKEWKIYTIFPLEKITDCFVNMKPDNFLLLIKYNFKKLKIKNPN